MKKQYHVPDMMCGHCVKKITEALKDAGVGFFSRKVDLKTKTVTVSSDKVDVVKVLMLSPASLSCSQHF